jgi:endoglucanase
MRFRALILAILAGLVAAPAANAYYSGPAIPGNPLSGHPWFVDKDRGSWWVTLREEPLTAAPLRRFADNPMGKTFAAFVAHPLSTVSDYLRRAEREDPGSIPFLNLSRMEGQSCPYPGTTAKNSEQAIERWLRYFSQAIGDARVEIALETDRLTVIGCLPGWARARRYREFRYEVHLLHENNPNAIVYIDAGASDWGKSPALMAWRLRKADVAEAQGFQVGASHFDWTWKEIRYGMAISRLLGGKHFVINTNANGWGPKPRWYSPFYRPACIPTGEGVGQRPSVKTPDPHIDAFVWAGVPGYENGSCIGYGQDSPYQFYPSLAVSLALHANPPL